MVDTNVKVYVTCTAALYLKFLATVMIQGGKTFVSGGRPPEDNKLSLAKKSGVKQNYGMKVDEKDEKILKAREVEHRWRRIIMNDLESIPFALFVFGGSILAGSNQTVHSVALIMYTAARYAHTVAYAKSLQPHRALFWFGGVLMTLVGIGNAVAALF
ncbi:Gtp-binding protein parf, partial [Globisporangium splendens]